MSTFHLHAEAMDIAEQAFIEKITGDADHARTLFLKAFELERQAALNYEVGADMPFSQGVLLRSAVSLALNGEAYREAERLACRALSEDPEPHIAEELRNLLKEIYDHWPTEVVTEAEEDDLQLIELIGRLDIADGLKHTIRLTDPEGHVFPYHIYVDQNFDEIVKDFWKRTVRITGMAKENSHRMTFREIDRLD